MREPSARWGRVAGPLALVALALAFRLPYLTARSLWYDEASSWQTAKFPWAEMLESVRLNVHMPLYYLLLKAWMAAFGESVAALRGFSVAFGVATVLAMNAFGREAYRASAASDGDDPSRARAFGFALAVLVAASPCQVFASIEARMYSLGTALAATSGWLLLRAVDRRGRMGRWIAYGASLVLLPYAHHYALFTAAAQFVFLGAYALYLAGLGDSGRARTIVTRAAVVGVVAAIAYLPGLDILTTQAGRVRQDYWVRDLTWEIVFGTFSEFLVPRPDYDQFPHGWIPFAAFAAACLVVARHARCGDGLVLALAIVPMALSAVVSMALTPVWVGRFFRFTHLSVLTTVLLAAWRLTRGRRGLRTSAIVAMFAGLVAANAAFWKGMDVENGRGVKGAVEFILAERKPGESIVALDLTQYFPAKYYVGDRAEVRMLEPGPDLFWGWHLIRPGDLIRPDQLDERLARGVWVIGTLPRPAVTPRLTEASPTLERVFTYYNHLHARVYVHHYRDAGDAGP